MTNNALRTGEVSLGNGIFTYSGVQDPKTPQLTIWRMSLCGAQMSAGGEGLEKVTHAYVITAPHRMTSMVELVKKIRNASAPK
jgi:hypothetical protein